MKKVLSDIFFFSFIAIMVALIQIEFFEYPGYVKNIQNNCTYLDESCKHLSFEASNRFNTLLKFYVIAAVVMAIVLNYKNKIRRDR